jgi:hypothetical protein
LLFIPNFHIQCSCLPVRIRPSLGFELDPLLPRSGNALLSLNTAEPFGTPFCFGFAADMLFGSRSKSEQIRMPEWLLLRNL